MVEEEEEEKLLIRLHDGQWESLWIANAIAQYIIEEGYGYPTEAIVSTSAVIMVILPRGEVDICLENWTQNNGDWYDEEVAKGNIEGVSHIMAGGPQFWIIPQWVHEEYGINTVDDMKDHWELFKDPEDPTKGVFVNSMIGWQCTEFNKLKMEAYGLTEYYNILDQGSAAASDAALVGAQKKHQPIFGYYWAPTSLMGIYDWYILEEPEADDEVWAKLTAAIDDESLRSVDEACAYPIQPLDNLIWTGLRDKAPDVVTFLEKYTLGVDRVNKAAAWSVDNEIQDYEKTAIWFLREYDSLWKTWVTTDAYNKIKAALAEED